MPVKSLPEMSGGLSQLLTDKLGVRKGSLDYQVARVGRRLPARIRAEAAEIAEAERLAANPKMARRIDPSRLARSYDDVARHLATIDPTERRTAFLFRLIATIAFNLLAVVAILIVVLRWRGLI